MYWFSSILIQQVSFYVIGSVLRKTFGKRYFSLIVIFANRLGKYTLYDCANRFALPYFGEMWLLSFSSSLWFNHLAINWICMHEYMACEMTIAISYFFLNGQSINNCNFFIWRVILHFLYHVIVAKYHRQSRWLISDSRPCKLKSETLFKEFEPVPLYVAPTLPVKDVSGVRHISCRTLTL